MTDLLWKVAALIISRPVIANWLIRRAQKTPYLHLPGYMNRWWLFNRYDLKTGVQKRRQWRFPVSIRVHHILVEDRDRVLHDHPWNARTVILKGWYLEEREGGKWHIRRRGATAKLRFGEYHRIADVSEGGVYTLFITGKYRGTWGFWVDGRKVPYSEYLGCDEG